MMEMALSQFVINLRYFLMSLSLTQKLDEKTTTLQRAVIAHGITDEIFALSSSKPKKVGFLYMISLMFLPILGWTGGTFLGAAASTLLPVILRDSLGIMIYGMFLAIIIPPCRISKNIGIVVLMAAVTSCFVSSVVRLYIHRKRICDHSLYVVCGWGWCLFISNRWRGTEMNRLLMYIVVMAGVTYLIRCLPLIFFRKKIQNRYIQSFFILRTLCGIRLYDFSCHFYIGRRSSSVLYWVCGCVDLSVPKTKFTGRCLSSICCRLYQYYHHWIGLVYIQAHQKDIEKHRLYAIMLKHKCRSGGTADTLSSGGSASNRVRVQISSSAP